MDENKKISYQPELTYVDEYVSDITFDTTSQDSDNISTEDNDIDLIEDLLNNGDALQNMVDKLPSDLSDMISDHLDPIIDFVKDQLKDKQLSKVPVPLEWNYSDNSFDEKDSEDTTPSIDDPDWDNIWDDDDFITIEKTVHTQEEIIEKEYVKNLYDLFEDYYKNLNLILSKFWTILLCSIMGKETSDIETIIDNILLSSSEIKDDRKHLLDLAVKSEIHKDMKMRYFSNNFDAEGSMKHLKQFKSIYELRLRYSKISKSDSSNSKLEQASNNILDGLSRAYDLKYDKAYENLYRYLKSSNVILEDSLNTAAQAIKAKQTLIDLKGVK